MRSTPSPEAEGRGTLFRRHQALHAHPPQIGWLGTTALAIGGSNQSLFLIGSLLVTQEGIPAQGSAAIPLLFLGLLLSYAAAFGWVELVLMSPNRVGGIAAACTAAFRPYSDVLSTLTAVCYWWGWVPTCGVTAILSATALHQWLFPWCPVSGLAVGLVVLFAALNLCGVKWVTRAAIPVAVVSAALAFVSTLAPILSGSVDWHRATDFHLETPFGGWFGRLTSLMAGLYLIGFAAPAFEAATCHVAETVRPEKNVPRAVLASAAMAAVYFVALPVVWLGVFGVTPLGGDLGQLLGPTFAPLFGAFGKSAAIAFMMLNMFHGTLQPLAGAARTLSQIAEDGLAPRFLSARMARTDAPHVAILVTAAFAIAFLLIGDPVWLIAAANLTYLIGIGLPSVAVWLLRRDAPHLERPYRAPRGTIVLGLLAACGWGVSTLLGFEQFGLPTVVFGLAMAYSGAALYAWRKWEDRRRDGRSGFTPTLHTKLTGAMLLVLGLDAVGYIIAVGTLPGRNHTLIVALEDIFVAVAMLTITVGVVLPGMIAHSANQISAAARLLASGTLRDFSIAMGALGRGHLDEAHAAFDVAPIAVRSKDELGELAVSFNTLQEEVRRAAVGLDGAREGLRSARTDIEAANLRLLDQVDEQRRLTEQLLLARDAAEAGNRTKSDFIAMISHELRTPMNGVIGMTELLLDSELTVENRGFAETIRLSAQSLVTIINDILDFSKLEAGRFDLHPQVFRLTDMAHHVANLFAPEMKRRPVDLEVRLGPAMDGDVLGDAGRLRQVAINLIGNALKFTERGTVTFAVSSLGDGRFRFEVSDTGIGIPEDKQAALFSMFTQIDGSTTRKYGGTGLGLAISKRIVELMGGQIGFTSRLGQGSTFFFTLPLPAAGDEPAADARSDDPPEDREDDGLQRLSVLVAEDNGVNQIVASEMLSRLGHSVEIVGDGAEAVARASARPFDIILMDIQMPNMDGLSAVREIRKLPSPLNETTIVAMTANAMNGDRERFLAAGMDDFLAKPITRVELASCLEKWNRVSLKKRDWTRPTRHQRLQTQTSPDPVAVTVDRQARSELLAEVGEDVMHRLLNTFTAGLPSVLGSVETAFTARNKEQLLEAVHFIAGGAGSLGFKRLCDEASRLEAQYRDPRCPPDIPIEELRAAVHDAVASQNAEQLEFSRC